MGKASFIYVFDNKISFLYIFPYSGVGLGRRFVIGTHGVEGIVGNSIDVQISQMPSLIRSLRTYEDDPEDQ